MSCKLLSINVHPTLSMVITEDKSSHLRFLGHTSEKMALTTTPIKLAGELIEITDLWRASESTSGIATTRFKVIKSCLVYYPFGGNAITLMKAENREEGIRKLERLIQIFKQFTDYIADVIDFETATKQLRELEDKTMDGLVFIYGGKTSQGGKRFFEKTEFLVGRLVVRTTSLVTTDLGERKEVPVGLQLVFTGTTGSAIFAVLDNPINNDKYEAIMRMTKPHPDCVPRIFHTAGSTAHVSSGHGQNLPDGFPVGITFTYVSPVTARQLTLYRDADGMVEFFEKTYHDAMLHGHLNPINNESKE
ncbi:hypothetical protein D9_0076 [Aeromonas phage D9]|nr:hypothetical protein D9_0076 [Aeromonas phage D9]